VHCYAPLTASSACGCRPPPARRLRVRRRLPPESNALPSRASVRRGVAAGRGALYIACASPPPKSSAAACVSVLECVHIEQLTINNNTRSTRNQATAPRREERCTAPGRLPSGAGRLRHSTEQTWLLSTFVGAFRSHVRFEVTPSCGAMTVVACKAVKGFPRWSARPFIHLGPTALKLTHAPHTAHAGSTPLADAGIRIAMPIARHTARAQVHACPCTLNAH